MTFARLHHCQLTIAARSILLLSMMCTVLRADEQKIERPELPRLVDMQLPSAEDLLRLDQENKEIDWVVLKNTVETDRRVVVVQPIFPRPDTIAKMAEDYKKVEASRPRNQKEREERTARMRSLQKLTIKLPGDLSDYAIPVDQVEQIIFFEDLMLQRVDQLLQDGDFRTAYELLLRVETEIPNWQKSTPRFERLLLVEAAERAKVGEMYAALALLDEAAGRNAQNAELPAAIAGIVDPMIADAISQEDYHKVRYLTGRIARLFPEHPTVTSTNQRLQSLSNDLMQKASEDFRQKKFAPAAASAREAQEIWPTTGNARAAFEQYFARHQVLRVGINEFQGSCVHPAPLEFDERLSELTEVCLFEPSSADELTYFRSGFFEVWDPSDLGREVLFTLRTTRPSWQTQPTLTASQIAEALGHRLNEQSPYYSPRLASFIREVSVRSPETLRIRFSRVPLSIESLLRFPATGQPHSDEQPAGQIAETVSSWDPIVTSTRFRELEATDSQRTWLRSIPEPDGYDGSKYHISEIQEFRFADRNNMIQAMNRGDLDYIPSLRPWEIDAFKASEFAVKPYAIPLTHVLIFNPLSDRIKNAQMRRALSFAVNREGILKSTVLRDPEMKYGRPSSAGWHLSSYATEPRQQPPRFNLRLAFALRFAAEKQLQIAELTKLTEAAAADAKKQGITFDSEKFRKETKVDYVKLPKLRFVVEPGPIQQAAAERMMIYWQRIGFDIELIRGDQAGIRLSDGDWDFCYRTTRMEEPLLELWPLIANDPTFDMNRLSIYPDWMRQELVGLDYATSFHDAQERLYRIHNHIAAQAFLIPLWEVDEFAAFRKSVNGVPDKLMSTYHNVERWMIRP